MRKQLFNILALVALSGATLFLASAEVHARDKNLLVSSFQDLEVLGEIQVVVTDGKTPKATASGDQNMLSRLKVERSGSTLRLRLQDRSSFGRNVGVTPLIVKISNRQLRNIRVQGNATVSVNTLSQSGISALEILGSGTLNVENVKADQLNIAIFGNGVISIQSGTARISRVNLEGAAKVDAAGFTSKSLELSQGGSSSTAMLVSERSVIKNTGAGTIIIGGDGRCDVTNTGSAAITCGK